MPTLTALFLTPSARDWLATTTTARVLNVFDRACNLINQDDAILALVTSERGSKIVFRRLNPFSMMVASEEEMPFRDLSVASVVRVEANRLVVGPLTIEVASARLWNPTPDWPALRRMFADNPVRLDELATLTLELASGGSLLDLYAEDGAGVRQQALLARAGRGAAELVRGLASRSIEQCIAGTRMLAGLGSGLTPAGDDFIVGVMLAVWAGLYGSGAEALCQPIAEAAAPLTTTLSAAYLRAAARGECVAHWHTLFEALPRSDAPRARAAIQSLMRIGHTSGADALAGFFAVHYIADGRDRSV